MKAIYDLMKSNNIKTITEKYTNNINELEPYLNTNTFSKLWNKTTGNERTFHIERHFSFNNKENSFIYFDSYRNTNNESFITNDDDKFSESSKNHYKEYFINEEDKISKIKHYYKGEYTHTSEYYTGEIIYNDYKAFREIEEEHCTLKITYDNNGNPKEIYYNNECYLHFEVIFNTIICKYNDRYHLSECICISHEYNIVLKLVLNYDYDNDTTEFSVFEMPLDNLDNIDKSLLKTFSFSFPFSDTHLVIREIIPTTNPNILKNSYVNRWCLSDSIEEKVFKKITQGRKVIYEKTMQNSKIYHNTFLNDISLLIFFTLELYENAKELYNGNTTRCLSHLIPIADFPKLKDNSISSDDKYTYEYDSRGNWIKKIGLINNKPTIFTERTIEYYD